MKPSLYDDLASPLDMEKWDKAAMQDIPALLLMENASREAWHVLMSYKKLTPHLPILVFIGGGNNGGDGAALARLLHEQGCNVVVCHIVPLSSFKGAAQDHIAMAIKSGVCFISIEAKLDSSRAKNRKSTNQEFHHAEKTELNLTKTASIENNQDYRSIAYNILPQSHLIPSIVIDALTGTGLKGTLREATKHCVEFINSLREHSFIFSLDIPSGLDGLTGKPLPIAVKAHATVTFEAAKPGLCMPSSHHYTGELHVHSIGIPRSVKKALPLSWQLLAPKADPCFRPLEGLHKGMSGKVVILGGSEEMPGAARLAALGALRAGAGLVTLLSPREITSCNRQPEIITVPIGRKALWQSNDIGEILSALDRLQPDAVVLGPGMGRNREIAQILFAVLETKRKYPLILDADALYFFHDIKEVIQEQDILTPHPKEMSRLMPDAFYNEGEKGISLENDLTTKTERIQQKREAALRFIIDCYPFVTVLKGAGTLIGQKNMPVTLCPKDIPTLAVAGSGDVLSGVIAAVAASGLFSYDAASLGVYLHASAGEILLSKAPKGHLASDIANAIPFAWQELLPNKGEPLRQTIRE